MQEITIEKPVSSAPFRQTKGSYQGGMSRMAGHFPPEDMPLQAGRRVWYADPVHTMQRGHRTRWHRLAASPRALPGLIALAMTLAPSSAWAVQAHGGPEGYLVHQMGHLFLGAALIFLLHLLRQRPPGTGKPWRHLQLSLLLFLLWDLDTMAIHWLTERLPNEAFIAGATLAGDRVLLPASWPWLFYYVGSLDHLLCVPAAWFLALSLKGLGDVAATRQPPTPPTPRPS